MSDRAARWGLLWALLLHNLEEALTVGAYLERSQRAVSEWPVLRETAARVTPDSFGWSLLAVSATAAVAVALGARWPVLPKVLAWIMLINVAVPHVPAAIALGGYSPGVLSAVLVNLPYAVWFLRRRSGKAAA